MSDAITPAVDPIQSARVALLGAYGVAPEHEHECRRLVFHVVELTNELHPLLVNAAERMYRTGASLSALRKLVARGSWDEFVANCIPISGRHARRCQAFHRTCVAGGSTDFERLKLAFDNAKRTDAGDKPLFARGAGPVAVERVANRMDAYLRGLEPAITSRPESVRTVIRPVLDRWAAACGLRLVPA